VVEWGPFVLKLAAPILKRIGGRTYDWYLQYSIRRDIRLGSGKKISIIIARLAEDTPADSFRTTLYETIRREFGNTVELPNWPYVEALGEGYEYDIERKAYAKVQNLLKERNCDLLISGRVKGKTADTTVLSLRFTVAEAEGRNPESYKLTETFDFPANFVGHLGAAISARVVMSAAPAAQISSHYLVPLMQAKADRLEPIVTRLNLGFDADTRGSLLLNYALVLVAIGQQAGLNKALVQAVAANRAALLEYTRERKPLDWAMTQNKLGNALKTLGERQNGTARLEKAVAAYRAALLEYTRERKPLD
jgi:hypothetical protein